MRLTRDASRGFNYQLVVSITRLDLISAPDNLAFCFELAKQKVTGNVQIVILDLKIINKAKDYKLIMIV